MIQENSKSVYEQDFFQNIPHQQLLEIVHSCTQNWLNNHITCTDSTKVWSINKNNINKLKDITFVVQHFHGAAESYLHIINKIILSSNNLSSMNDSLMLHRRAYTQAWFEVLILTLDGKQNFSQHLCSCINLLQPFCDTVGLFELWQSLRTCHQSSNQSCTLQTFKDGLSWIYFQSTTLYKHFYLVMLVITLLQYVFYDSSMWYPLSICFCSICSLWCIFQCSTQLASYLSQELLILHKQLFVTFLSVIFTVCVCGILSVLCHQVVSSIGQSCYQLLIGFVHHVDEWNILSIGYFLLWMGFIPSNSISRMSVLLFALIWTSTFRSQLTEFLLFLKHSSVSFSITQIMLEMSRFTWEAIYDQISMQTFIKLEVVVLRMVAFFKFIVQSDFRVHHICNLVLGETKPVLPEYPRLSWFETKTSFQCRLEMYNKSLTQYGYDLHQWQNPNVLQCVQSTLKYLWIQRTVIVQYWTLLSLLGPLVLSWVPALHWIVSFAYTFWSFCVACLKGLMQCCTHVEVPCCYVERAKMIGDKKVFLMNLIEVVQMYALQTGIKNASICVERLNSQLLESPNNHE